jgi:hypothetical protein
MALRSPTGSPGSPGVALLAAAALLASAACTQTVKETYDIDITGAPDAFAGAMNVTLYASGTEVASAKVEGNAPFALAWRDVDPLERSNAVFSIKATDGNNAVVAAGAAPEVELLPTSTKIRIFVQRPGSFARAPDLERSLAGHVAVSTEALTSQGLRLAMNAPVFGAGQQRAANSAEVFSGDMYVYNPVTHVPQRLGTMQGTPRADAAALARTDGVVMVFGGYGREPTTAAQTGARLDYFRIGRRDVNTFEMVLDTGVTGPPDTARSRSVMVQVGRFVFAFGGLDIAGAPVDTVVNIDPEGRPSSVVELATRAVGMGREPTHMSTGRVGHTASVVSTPGMAATATTPLVTPQTLVLVFGGAPAGGPVADLFNPADQSFLPLDLAMAGTGRKLHAAVNVTVSDQARLLLIGGQADDGSARGDSIIYDPTTRTFAPGPLALRTPRHQFTAFVIGNDLVVAGGIGPDGSRLATAEVYDARTFAFVAELKTEARAAATATPLPNLTMMLIGGTIAGPAGTDTAFSSAIEIYQPRGS